MAVNLKLLPRPRHRKWGSWVLQRGSGSCSKSHHPSRASRDHIWDRTPSQDDGPLQRKDDITATGEHISPSHPHQWRLPRPPNAVTPEGFCPPPASTTDFALASGDIVIVHYPLPMASPCRLASLHAGLDADANAKLNEAIITSSPTATT